jgi:hypothetical protein
MIGLEEKQWWWLAYYGLPAGGLGAVSLFADSLPVSSVLPNYAVVSLGSGASLRLNGSRPILAQS